MLPSTTLNRHRNQSLAQNSILGPLVLLCINDLLKVFIKLFAILFVDDTSVFLEAKKLIDITKILNEELAKLTLRLSANKFTLNAFESHFIFFHGPTIIFRDAIILL